MISRIKLFGIDDDKVLIEVLGLILKQNKDVVPAFELFTEEGELLKALTPEVQICLVDYNLSDINGNELIRQIMKTNPYCWFIMMSGQKDADIIIKFINMAYGTRFLEKGAVDFTEKLLFFIKDIIQRIDTVEEFFYIARSKTIKMKESLNKLADSITDLKETM